MLYNLSKNDTPSYLHYYKVNNGYRYGGTYLQCLKSMFTIFHNESINAFTSLFNSVIAIYGFIYGYYNNFNLLALSLWTFGVMASSLISFGFHTFSPINKYHYSLWINLDIITIYISGICQSLSFSIIFLPFNLMLCNVLYTLILIVYLKKVYRRITIKKHIPALKQITNVTLCTVNLLLPLAYNVIYDYNIHSYRYLCYMIYVIIAAGVIFGFKIPEVYFKEGTFNKIGHSHHFMHICVSLYCYYIFMFIKSYYKS